MRALLDFGPPRVGGRAQFGELRDSAAAELAFQAGDVGGCSRRGLETIAAINAIFLAVTAGPVRWASARTAIGPTQAPPSGSPPPPASSRTSPAEIDSRRRFKAAASVERGARRTSRCRPPRIICSFRALARAPRPAWSPWRLKGASRFSMKNTGDAGSHARGKRRPRNGFLDAPLVVEVGDARPLVRRPHGRVDVVVRRRPPRAKRRKTLALAPLPPSTPATCVFCTPNTPHAPAKRHGASVASSSRSPLTMVDAVVRQPPAARSPSGFARQACANGTRRPAKACANRAALIAGYSGDENRSNCLSWLKPLQIVRCTILTVARFRK